MKHLSILYAVFICLVSLSAHAQSNIYQVAGSKVYFHSDAPKELIRATTNDMVGVVDIAKRTFLFKIGITSFAGFNSPLQKEHFNENYMESDRYPTAVYSGKIIEEIDISKDGDYFVRAKGKLLIHGVEHQKVIKCHVVCKNHEIAVQSDFIVALSDYDIKIPRIVSDKLSEEIKVSVTAKMIPAPASSL